MRLVALRHAAFALFLLATPLAIPLFGQNVSAAPAQPSTTPVPSTQASLRVPALFTSAESSRWSDPTGGGVSSSLEAPEMPEPAEGSQRGFEAGATGRNKGRISRDPNYGHIGAAVSVGVNGITADLALPITRFFDVRIGGSGFRYASDFYENDAQTYIHGLAQFAYGKAAVDLYPLGGRFRVSPMLVFANYTQAMASINFEGGKEFDLEDGSFISAPYDPVRGFGRVDFRHTAPGLTIGSSNFTRGYGRFTFPVELGAIYVGKPTLQLNFTGSACNNGNCQSVDNDPQFQDQLTAARARADDDLKYAHFLPILNFGVGYRF